MEHNFIPHKPFPEFKWQWATFAPTESINDPVVLLGVLFRMAKLEGKYRFSSEEFNKELINLSNDLHDSIGVNLAGRGGERNIMRNSQQYWKALQLIPKETHGIIHLTEFGRMVANHDISQTEFSAATVITLTLPNENIQEANICKKWYEQGIRLRPLHLILSICRITSYITSEELVKIIIPLSAYPTLSIDDFVFYIHKFREGKIDTSKWPDCCPSSNDKRMAREFLLFLANYGYLVREDKNNRYHDKYHINTRIITEIDEILKGAVNQQILSAIQSLKQSDVIADVERKRSQTRTFRPHQAQFRRDVLKACQRCIITNVTMPEVLEAAHIKPYKYHGEDTIANGFAMRVDIHILFDTGHLRISDRGEISLSGKARLDYGALIPPRIVIPEFINRDYLRWRWENYNGI